MKYHLLLFLSLLLIPALCYGQSAQFTRLESPSSINIDSEITLPGILRVTIDNLKGEATEVRLNQLHGPVLYQSRFNEQNNYARDFNFRVFDRGKFVLSVIRDDEILRQVVVIRYGRLHTSAVSRYAAEPLND